jgi:hypothetical protein
MLGFLVSGGLDLARLKRSYPAAGTVSGTGVRQAEDMRGLEPLPGAEETTIVLLNKHSVFSQIIDTSYRCLFLYPFLYLAWVLRVRAWCGVIHL